VAANYRKRLAESTRPALAARVSCASSLSSRPTTPSRRSCPPWACRPRRPNSGLHDRLRLNRRPRVEAGSTDRTSTRRMGQTALCGRDSLVRPGNPGKTRPAGRVVRLRPRRCPPSGFSDASKKHVRKNYGLPKPAWKRSCAAVSSVDQARIAFSDHARKSEPAGSHASMAFAGQIYRTYKRARDLLHKRPPR